MSYILDALRRADSERDRGSVPGLHAQQVPVSSAGALRERSSIVPWLVAAVALVVVAALVWRLLDRDAPRTDAAAVAMTPPVAAAPVPSTLQPAPAPAPAQTLAAASPPPRAMRRVAPAMDRSLPAAAAEQPQEAAIARPPTASAGPPSKGLVYNRNELPAELQRQLPNLQIGGATYSHDAASRMLIINGQIFHEGDVLAPDLTLDQIELKAAVFRFKGYRYRTTF